MIIKVDENFLKDSLGRFRTTSLFYEYATNNTIPIWTIHPEDRLVDKTWYLSLKKMYMEYRHIPYAEYEFAMDLFGSWEHWDRLSNEGNKILVNSIAQWRIEMEIKIRAESLKAIIVEANSFSGASSVAAAKYIAEKGYDKKAGRPSKAAVKKELKVQSAIAASLDDDANRIGLEDEVPPTTH